MSIELYLEKDKYKITEAYALLQCACDISYIRNNKEKETKYAYLLLGELKKLEKKYKIKKFDIYCVVEMFNKTKITDDELIERADKLLEHA